MLQARFTVCKSDTTVKFIQYRFQMINLFASLLLYTWTDSLKKCYSSDFLVAFLILRDILVKGTQDHVPSQSIV